MTSNNNNSIMDSLRSAGEAWLAAGSAVGGVVSEFAAKLREDRSAVEPTGAHAAADTTSQEGLLQQLRGAVDNARGAFNSADSDSDFRAAATTFAADAEAIFRDVAGSVSRAGSAAVQSDQADEAKAAFGSALSEVKETFNQAVANVRNRAEESDVDAEGVVKDLHERLDTLIAKVSEQVSRPDSGHEEPEDIIDGEVIRDQDGNNGDSAV
ncbi:CGLAU_01105 family protein [Corynebacterium lipophiloflavum]|uniref:Uncharacterized protein n=1 Tax=Corynebacterium lipophiloflavum (strain ATCC 700352 / DSM 44291 / CCUG 37336 / JCM 10383 / DMMZ 1944) TaxID=525263 RepID=C0XUC2_CORLD|nr:CGLAU_01105 family protein [Corynebacterium lipophiloflavum]EEI16188.1 hypothetical protein HMPREF0298_2042 [Corynebacterium lipophiloflavum DSM 44291]